MGSKAKPRKTSQQLKVLRSLTRAIRGLQQEVSILRGYVLEERNKTLLQVRDVREWGKDLGDVFPFKPLTDGHGNDISHLVPGAPHGIQPGDEVTLWGGKKRGVQP